MSDFNTVYDQVEQDARRPISCRYDPHREDTYYSNAAALAAERERLTREAS